MKPSQKIIALEEIGKRFTELKTFVLRDLQVDLYRGRSFSVKKCKSHTVLRATDLVNNLSENIVKLLVLMQF
jgi:hypothetical protein